MTDTFTPTWPWPFPHWNDTRYVMPAELMTEEQRKEFFKEPDVYDAVKDVEEAPL